MADLSASPAPVGATRSVVAVRDRRFERCVVPTRWVRAGDDLAALVAAVVAAHPPSGGVVAVTEKVVVVAEGRSIPAGDVVPGRLARFLAGRVHPVGDSRGISVPEKMQLILERQGTARVLVATLVAALTRPLGLRGGFYLVAGDLARSIDGMRPPYEDVLLPPLDVAAARRTCTTLATVAGTQVAIVDINDRGGSVRAVSAGPISAATLMAVLRDNPLGQRTQATPIAVVRELDRGVAPAQARPRARRRTWWARATASGTRRASAPTA